MEGQAPQDDLTAERAAKLYSLLHATISHGGIFGPDDIKAIRKMEIVDKALIIAALQAARQEALRELRERLEKREQFYTEQEAQSEGQMRLTRGLQRNEASGCIAELDRLASEGA